jgi:hypothetical protein
VRRRGMRWIDDDHDRSGNDVKRPRTSVNTA